MREFELRKSEVVIVINKDQEIVFCSEDSLEILGYLPKELEGKLITVLMNPRQARVHGSHINNYIENGRYRADIGKFDAIKKDGSNASIYVWVNSKKPFYLKNDPYIVGVIWDADILEGYNDSKNREQALMKKIEHLAQSWIEEKHETNKELINIKAMLGIKLNPLMSDEQKNMSIQIINEGGKATQDTNIDQIDGDANITQNGS